MKRESLLDICKKAGIDYVSSQPCSSGWISCKCPFAPYLHTSGKDSKPSFFVKVDDQGPSAGHCFSCGVKGRISSILRQLSYYTGEDHNSLIIEADLQDIPSGFGSFDNTIVMNKNRVPIPFSPYKDMFPPVAMVKEALHYLLEKRINQSGGFGTPIGKYAASLMGLRYDPFQRRILFPVQGRNNDFYGFSGRSILSKEELGKLGQPKIRDYNFEKSMCLLGEHLFQERKPVLLVEGLFAYATMVAIGARQFCNPMATMGAVLHPYQMDILIDMDQPVYLLFDNDAAGQKGAKDAFSILKNHLPVFICEYPEDVDDPDDLTKVEVYNMIKELDSKWIL